MQQQNDRPSHPRSNDSVHSSNGDCAELTHDILDIVAKSRSIPPMQVGDLAIEHTIDPPSDLEISPSSHHFLLFNLGGSGSGTRQVNKFDGGEYDGAMNSGDFFFLPSGIPAHIAWETTDESVILIVSPNFLTQIAATTESLNPDKIEMRSVLLDRDPQIETIARSFLSEMTTDSLGGKLYTESLANLFGIHLLRHYCVTPATLRVYQGGLSDFQLKCAIDYIRSHLDAQLSLENIAAELNLSHYYFCVLFKQSMGVSPWQYVIGQRIEKAKELLRDRLVAISDIGLTCGFGNQSHFTKLFHKHTGITPKAYRSQSSLF
jgi:AraC family transcriptional regulator